MTDITRLLAMDSLAARCGGGLNPALRALLLARLAPQPAGTVAFPGPVHSAGPAQQAVPATLPAGVSRLPAPALAPARQVKA